VAGTIKVTLPEAIRQKLRAAIEQHGLTTVAKWLGQHRETVTRAAGGFEIHKGTAFVIERGMGSR
jgi:hypothetical protein